MHAFTSSVLNTIRRETLLKEGDTVLVALSGGADSVALLHVLIELRDVLKLSALYAAHVHHGLRGEFADRDETFVKDLCEKHDIPLYSIRVDTKAEAHRYKESVEEAGRRLRYAFFEQQAASLDAVIATAHTSSDQAETVLYRMIRGSGLKGICGIPIKRGNIVRPLLDCSAIDVRSYCDECGYAYVTDETNVEMCYARNRIRHEILPSMRQINPQAERAIVRLSETASQEERFLDNMAQTLYERALLENRDLNVSVLNREDIVLRRRALCKWIPDVSYAHVLDILDILADGGCVNISSDRSVVCDGVRLSIVQRHREKNIEQSDASSLVIGQAVSFNGKTYLSTLISYEEYCEIAKIHKNLFNFCISYDMIKTDVQIRSRMEGDSIRPFARKCSKSIKKLMNEFKIPCDERSAIPVIVCEEDILLLLGYCVDETAAVTDQTKRVLWIREL